MFIKEIFYERLKAARINAGLSQSAVGEKFNAPKQYISRWEKGVQEPSLAALYDLADALDVSVDYLLGLSDVQERR